MTNVEAVESELQEELRTARKSLKCPEIIFKDVGTKDIMQVRRTWRKHRIKGD